MYHLVGGVGYYEKLASRTIRSLVNGSKNYWHTPRDQHTFACATHARSRYQAIKMAKEAHKQRLLSGVATGRLTSRW